MLNHPTFAPWPNFSEEEANIIKDVLLSNKVNYWTGDEARKFEQEFAQWTGAKYAVSLANGTLALDLALKALEIGPGDEVIVSPRTFIASVSCVVNAGAKPVFADVDPFSGNITAQTISQVLTPQTTGIICVHLSGWPCDMDPIIELAKKHGIKVIEDCAQAHGAQYKGKSVGTIGHIGAWSFCQDKIMTTGGEGGMVTTNDENLWRKMWSYKDHGKSYHAVYEREHPPGFRWLHESFGTNWRMLEIQAAIGRYQLKKMDTWNKQRTHNVQYILYGLKKYNSIRIPEFKCQKLCDKQCPSKSKCRHAYYKYYFYIEPKNLKEAWSRDRIIKEINELDIPCFHGSCSEVYLEKAFNDSGFRPIQRQQVAKELGENSIMLLVHPSLTKDNLDSTIAVINDVLDRATA